MWEPPTYNEKVKGYYVVPDKDLLIIDGEKYSYIFDILTDFKAILSVSHELEFQATYRNFKIDKNNIVSGELELFVELTNDSPKLEKLLDLGFVQRKKGIIYNTHLSGKLYKLEGNLEVTSFDKEQYITVETPEGGITAVGKVILTPVAVTADAIAVISVLSLVTVGYYSAIITD
ncbi:hypothetical protein [Vibrio sp. MACH09]|uniref:hypothetical protein n=1 Tax=Vibrio sp. MACH09 TaxID=3025122 RepID=UPI00295EB5DC|nr:hypothetical protein [Vibrio sp. MACH09]